MGEPVKKIEQTPESYNPKDRPEILTMARRVAFSTDTIADPFAGGEPPRKSNKIMEYRKIESWQNYFLCSGICSVGLKLGSGIDDFHFYANLTGDNFTYLYAAEKGNPNNVQCDSGVTNYFFVPQFVKKAYAAFGYDCIYLSNAQIKKDFRAVMNAIKASVDKGIPVLAWGLVNEPKDWCNYTGILPEGCLVGGYDENDVLFVNLYNTRGKPNIDEYGYSTIVNALDNVKGIFFTGEPIEKPDTRQIYQGVIESIPTFLTMPTAEGDGGRYVFGKTAFEIWADTLETDLYYENKTDDELNGICWNLHCSPYCCVCTSYAYDFFKNAVEYYPDLTMAVKLLPLYEKMQNYRQEIWALQGGFYPPMEKFRTHEFRAEIAKILRKMGSVCDEILMAYEDGEIVQTPESYSPKNKPVILEMVSETSAQTKPEPRAAASTIPAEARNTVRIIELPACKMVTSGPAIGEDAFAPGGGLDRFDKWFSEYDKQRIDHFYPRDFMWSPPGGGFQWGYAVDEIPADTNGLEVIDFPGGLYAVAISVDADGQDHDRVYNGILDWVSKSGCFVLDETDERRSMGNITSPQSVKNIMGYNQMDLYFPIAIKEAGEND